MEKMKVTNIKWRHHDEEIYGPKEYDLSSLPTEMEEEYYTDFLSMDAKDIAEFVSEHADVLYHVYAEVESFDLTVFTVDTGRNWHGTCLFKSAEEAEAWARENVELLKDEAEEIICDEWCINDKRVEELDLDIYIRGRRCSYSVCGDQCSGSEEIIFEKKLFKYNNGLEAARARKAAKPNKKAEATEFLTAEEVQGIMDLTNELFGEDEYAA